MLLRKTLLYMKNATSTVHSAVQLHLKWSRHFSAKQAYTALTVQSTTELLISELYIQHSSAHVPVHVYDVCKAAQ